MRLWQTCVLISAPSSLRKKHWRGCFYKDIVDLPGWHLRKPLLAWIQIISSDRCTRSQQRCHIFISWLLHLSGMFFRCAITVQVNMYRDVLFFCGGRNCCMRLIMLWLCGEHTNAPFLCLSVLWENWPSHRLLFLSERVTLHFYLLWTGMQPELFRYSSFKGLEISNKTICQFWNRDLDVFMLCFT